MAKLINIGMESFMAHVKPRLTASDSIILNSLSTYKRYETYGFIDPSIRKDPSLGRIFPSIELENDGSLQLELGLVLPDLLPNSNGSSINTYSIRISSGKDIAITLCNSMATCSFLRDGEEYDAIFPIEAFGKLPPINGFSIPTSILYRPLRTFATFSVTLSGEYAEDVIESSIENVLDEFLEGLNVILAANQQIFPNTFSFFASFYDRTSFDYLYVSLSGRDGVKIPGKIALGIAKAIYHPQELTVEQFEIFKNITSGLSPIDETTRMLTYAKNALDGGVLYHALILIVVSTEALTSQTIELGLKKLGVSNKGFERIEKDLTFSLMLNAVIWAVSPDHLKPDRDTIGILNEARGKRNEWAHKAQLNVSKADILRYHAAAGKWITHLHALQDHFEMNLTNNS